MGVFGDMGHPLMTADPMNWSRNPLYDGRGEWTAACAQCGTAAGHITPSDEGVNVYDAYTPGQTLLVSDVSLDYAATVLTDHYHDNHLCEPVRKPRFADTRRGVSGAA